MANVPNFPITISGLETLQYGDTSYTGQAIFLRRCLPQPFNTRGVESNRPASGQMWPRGDK